MILAAVDDLMLASKIRQGAAGAGVDLVFARSSAEIVEHVRSARPDLVIFDLDSARLEPLAAAAALKAHPSLASIPTLAFVSHVHADLIASARAVGVDRVLARSAFFEKLMDILREARTAPPAAPEITLRDIYRARDRVAGFVRTTPLVESAWLSDLAGGDVRLKLESLQVTNSFKTRGTANLALSLVEHLPPGAPRPVLVTASAGNAGRAFAFVAQRLGLRTIIFTPRDAPRAKLDAIRRHGAELRAEADTYEDAERLAKAYAAKNGLAYTSPYSHPDLVAGFGTVALEVFEQFPDVNVFLVPVGGGGLISGIAIAAKATSRAIRTIGVEVEASHPFAVSIREGRITEVPVGPTIADGLAGNMDPATITFDLARRYVDELVQVSEDALVEGIRGLATEEHLIAEGAGIAAVAAVLSKRVDLKGRRAAVIVTGANIDGDRLRKILT